MNKRVAKPSVKSPRYIAAKANTGQRWITADNPFSRCWSTTTNYIRFQWAFRHPRDWRRYKLVTSGEASRYKDVKYHGRACGMELYSSPSVREGFWDTTFDKNSPEAIQARTNYFAAKYLEQVDEEVNRWHELWLADQERRRKDFAAK